MRPTSNFSKFRIPFSMVACILAVLALILTIGWHIAENNTSGAVVNTEAYGEVLHNEVKTVVVDLLREDNDTSEELTDAITASILEKLNASDEVPFDKEAAASAVLDAIASGKVEITEVVADALADSISDTVIAQIAASGMFVQNLSEYATKEELSSLQKEVSNAVSSHSSSKLTLTDAQKAEIAALIIKNGGASSLTDAQVKEIVRSAISSYSYTISDNDKKALSDAVTASVTSQINSLSTDVQTMKQTLQSTQSQLNALSSQASNARGTGADYSAQITALQNEVNTLKNTSLSRATAAETYATLSNLSNEIERVEGEIVDAGGGDVTTAQLNAVKDELQSNIDAVQDALTSTDTAVSGLNTSIANAVTRINTLETTSATQQELDSVANDLNNAVNTIGQQITDAETAITGLQSNINTLQNNMSTMSGDIGTLTTDISDLSDSLEEYQGTVAAAYATKEALQNAVTTLTNQTASTYATQTTVGDLNDRVVALETIANNLNTTYVSLNTYQDFCDEFAEWQEQVNTLLRGLASAWNTSNTYTQNDLVVYNNQIWRCKVASIAANTAWNPANWENTTLGSEISRLRNNLTASDNLAFRFATDGEGNYGYLDADDSFVPFRRGTDASLEPGLYKDGALVYSWQGLKDEGFIHVNNGVLTTNHYWDEWGDYDYQPEETVNALDGDLIVDPEVTSLGDYAFCYCENLTSVQLPDTATALGESAFYDCYSLANINLPDGIQSIPDSAFTGAPLISITIPDTVQTIGYSAFTGNHCTQIHIPDSVTYINDRAFSNCKMLRSVTGCNNVTYIGSSAFESCSALQDISALLAHIDTIKDGTFRYCHSLGSVTIPGNIQHIEFAAFQEALIGSVNFNSGLLTIGELAFAQNRIASLNLPDTVTSVDRSAFFACTDLVSVAIPSHCVIAEPAAGGNDSVFANCNELMYITVVNPDYMTNTTCNAVIEQNTNRLIVGCINSRIPSTVSQIGRGAFSGLRTLLNIELVEGITEIDDYAFYDTSLTEVHLPSTITRIGKGCFWSCDQLTDVYYNGTKNDWRWHVSKADKAFDSRITVVHCTDGNTSITN